MVATPKEPVAFKELAVEKKQLAVYGATYWCRSDGKGNLFERRWEVWLANRAEF